jgi:hypothetical protein
MNPATPKSEPATLAASGLTPLCGGTKGGIFAEDSSFIVHRSSLLQSYRLCGRLFLSAADICAITGLKDRTHMRKVMKDQIGAVKPGKRIMCPISAVEIWLEQNRFPTIADRAQRILRPAKPRHRAANPPRQETPT